MTALDKLLAAIEAGRRPASGTYKDAAAELAETLYALRIHVFHSLRVRNDLEEAEKYWKIAMQMAELKGSIEAQRLFESGLNKVVKEFTETPPAEIVSLANEMSTTRCSVSDCEKPAKVWEKGVAYCKTHAREAGIDFHGKV